MKQVSDDFLEFKGIHEYLLANIQMDLHEARPYLNRISEFKKDPYVKHYALERGFNMDQWVTVRRKKRNLDATWEFQGTY